jgi:hypothetical protein
MASRCYRVIASKPSERIFSVFVCILIEHGVNSERGNDVRQCSISNVFLDTVIQVSVNKLILLYNQCYFVHLICRKFY